MAQVEFTGKAQTFTWNSVAFTGVQKVDLNEEAGPAPEDLDVTTNTDSVYTYLADPLGTKGNPKCTVTVTLQDSAASYADNSNTKHAFNTKQAATWDLQPGTANAQTWTHAALELTKRVTEIPWDGFATCTLTFEANAVGAWDSPA